MTTSVHRPNEISLFGTYYPIVGTVNPLLASQFAPKQTVGDYTKDSEEIGSTWIISDQRGGIGIKDMEEYDKEGKLKDVDRCWWSTSWLGTKGHLVLPVLVTDTGNDTSADPAMLIEYDNTMYCAFGTSVRKWAEGTSTWGSNLNTLIAVPTDAIVYKGKLYFASDTDFERFDGSSWTDGATLGTAQKSRYFVEWDEKLFSLDNTGQLDYSVDEGVTWITSALSSLPDGTFTSLFKGRDASDTIIIYLGTKQGLFALNFADSKWVETDLKLPFHDYACQGADSWRAAGYIPSGMALYEHKPPDVNFVGLDRDYGTPVDYQGSIVKILPGHNALYALVDATLALNRDLYSGGEGNNVTIYDNEGYSGVFRWTPPPEGGWSVVHLSGAATTPISTGVIATADDIYRLWFAMDSKVWFMPLQVTIQNPLEVATYEYGASSEHITPWFDKDNSVSDALAYAVSGFYEAMSSDEYIMLSYGVDGDDDTWTLLTNSDFPDGQIDTNGEVEFELVSGAGLSFKSIRFKEELFRGSTTTKSPDRRWLRMAYIKLLEPKYGFSVRVDCARNYRFKSARTLTANLDSALKTQTLGVFQYKDAGASETHRVRISDKKGVEVGGKRSKGLFEITLVAP